MKIIHLILGKANPDRMNGVNKVVYSLASTQQKLGYDVEVWGITPKIDSGISHQAPFRIRLFRAYGNPFAIGEDLVTRLNNLKGEIVFQMHGAFIPQFFTISKHLKWNNKAFILTPHGAYNAIALRKNRMVKMAYYFLIEKPLLKRAARVHLLGEKESGYTVQWMSSKKKIIIPNGQHIPENVHPAKATVDLEQPIFGFMGRLDKSHKGLDKLISALSIYKNKLNGKGILWLIGDGEDRKFLEQMVKQENLSSAVKFWGKQFGEDKDKLVEQINVFMHPSRYEGIPMAVLECALMGIPAIVSPATNVDKTVEKYHCGVGIKNINPDTIAHSMKKMEDVLGTPEYDEMRLNAVKMVKEVYDWDIIAKRFYELYEDIV